MRGATGGVRFTAPHSLRLLDRADTIVINILAIVRSINGRGPRYEHAAAMRGRDQLRAHPKKLFDKGVGGSIIPRRPRSASIRAREYANRCANIKCPAVRW